MHGGRIAGRTGRAVARPVRVARSHVPRVLLAAVALIVVLFQESTAYALPWAEKDGYPLGEILMSQDVGSNRGTVVYGAANEFFATLCLIGRKSDYLQLSSEQLSELSGEGTGGAFWELSQRWNNYESDGMPDTWPIGISAAMQAEGLISDPAYIWYADYSYYESDSLYNRALDDYLTIYNGGHLGGGSGSGGYYEFSGYVRWRSTTVGTPDYLLYGGVKYINAIGNYSGYQLIASPLTVRIPKSCFANVDSNSFDSYSGKYIHFSFGANSGPIVGLYFGNSLSASTAVNSQLDTNSYIRRLDNSGTYYYSSIAFSSDFTYENGVITYTGNRLFSNPSSSTTSIPVSEALGKVILEFGSPSGGGGGGGGGTWPDPDPPTPPNPPEVPGPGTNDDPGIELPDPYMPIVDPVTDPDPITDPYVVVAAPDSSDIIEWLRAILRAINNLGDKLNAESTELQNALNKVFFNNLSRLLKNLKGELIQDYSSWLNKELQWLNSEVHGYFVDLQNYLYQLFDWLAEQMNFEVSLETDPYDDTSLLNWLRRIYNKLGADDGPNTRPVDPSTDEDGFLDWLRRMIQNFILDLGAAASDVVSDLGDLLSRLFAKFPFSVPWDLLAILGILDAPTMVPRLTFDVPLTLGTSTFTWHVDVDMEPWSAYMEAVRTIMLVSFISWLIWLTPQVLRDLDPGDFL